ncbi:MAG: TIM barrel protein [Candidatus Diapherotrites archaeon]|nr:TIM barrel protein [Candidatus Diapherotrites archaeon]
MKTMQKLFFGTPGIPSSTVPYNTIDGVKEVKRLGLDAMELEFVHSINISKEKASLVKEAAQKNDVNLTCHGQYFINLNAIEKKKLEASKKRIFSAAQRAFECGAWSVCFHPAYYMDQEPAIVYQNVKNALKEVVKQLEENGVKIWIRPETAGKISQFGSLQEILGLCQEIAGVAPCIDFSHLYARTAGKNNSLEEFRQVLVQVEKVLGKEGLSSMHIHAQGIEFTKKGEKNHAPFDKSGFNYKELVKAFKEFRITGVVICESPLVEKDALKLQNAFLAVK